MNLGILTLIHGREELTRSVLDYYTRVKARCSNAGVWLDLTAAASLTDSWAMDIPGWKVRFKANKPIVDKWRFGLQYFKDRDVDAVMVIGSDDLVHWTTLVMAAELCTKDNPYWMPCGVFFVNDHDGRLFGQNEKDITVIYRAARRVGAGRIIHRSLIDLLDWDLWQGDVGGGDSAMDKRLERYGKAKRYGGTVVDIKTDENMWRFEQMARPGLYTHADLSLVESMIGTIKA